MIKKVKYDEDFFVKYCKEVPLDFSLPFKLQKRELLEKLRFPVDNSLLIPVRKLSEIKITFSEWIKVKKKPFLIGCHLKPLLTYITPFFIIEGEKNIKYRDEFGKNHILTHSQLFKKITSFPSQSWIEFIQPIWGSTTVAGRLIYFSSGKQLIEIQKGVFPDDIGNKREKFPYFATELYYFQADIRNHLGNFDRREVKSIITSLEKCHQGFESLVRIAEMPTLEFGYDVQKRKLVVIDIDWPKQYQY